MSAATQHTHSTTRPGRRGGAVLALAGALLLSVPGGAGAQGWIEPPPDRPGVGHVERVRTRVQVDVDGPGARVEVTEWFRNRGGRVAEGHYLYPLPADAAFDGFSLYQGERELRGELMDAREARSIYEAIVRRRKDPALIELAGHGLLRARVFPIEPGQTRKVTLRYTQLLERSGDALHFRYAAPRGGAPDLEAAGGRPAAGGGALELRLSARPGDRFLDPFSPTHELRAERAGGELRVRTEGALEGRLSVFLPLVRDGVGLTAATHARPGEDGFVLLSLTPGRTELRGPPRDVTAVVDVSGSMSGEKLEQARAALRDLLGTLGPRDRFRLVAFSTAVRPHAEGWRRAVDGQLADARTWIGGLTADGGTNVAGALDEAFRLQSPAERLPVVVFLTDGLPSVGERDPDRIAARARQARGRARVFAFGVGHDVNTRLLDRLSAETRGATQYVEPGESVERAVSLLAARVRHPVLTDLRLVSSPVPIREMYPVEIPDVFAGEALVLLARYRRPERDLEGPVVLEGRRGGEAERFSARVAFPGVSDAHPYLPRLWASRKLGFLTRKTWTDGTHPELVEEIRRVALRFGLPSPYTSYLVLEPGARAASDRVRPAVDPAARAPSQGAGAVRRAQEARRMRDVSRAEELSALEREAGSGSGIEGAEQRRVAGRLFLRVDGVWSDAAMDDADPVIRIAPFSRAYFDLLRALPEVKPYFSAFQRVRVAAHGRTVEVAPDGRTRLAAGELERIASAYRRGGAGVP